MNVYASPLHRDAQSLSYFIHAIDQAYFQFIAFFWTISSHGATYNIRERQSDRFWPTLNFVVGLERIRVV